MTADRLATGYQPDFDIDLAHGQQAEMFVSDIIAALRDQTAEVKRDDRAAQTGNVYIEYECLRGGEWQPSGISTTKALVWVFVLGGLALAAPTATVAEVARRHYPTSRRELTRGSHPTRGVVIPLDRYISELQAAGLCVLSSPGIASGAA